MLRPLFFGLLGLFVSTSNVAHAEVVELGDFTQIGTSDFSTSTGEFTIDDLSGIDGATAAILNGPLDLADGESAVLTFDVLFNSLESGEFERGFRFGFTDGNNNFIGFHIDVGDSLTNFTQRLREGTGLTSDSGEFVASDSVPTVVLAEGTTSTVSLTLERVGSGFDLTGNFGDATPITGNIASFADPLTGVFALADIDGATSPVSFTVSVASFVAVPEPGSLVFLLVGLGTLAIGRRR